MSALTNFSNIPATQMEQARHDQVKNNAGGFVFKTSEVARLERFLILFARIIPISPKRIPKLA